jgi:peptidoglycan/xylan/chitin deacetylase (PgdA/CDA1 family)
VPRISTAIFTWRKDRLKVAVQARAPEAEVIRELLSPWACSFTSLDQAEVAIAYNEKPSETKKTIAVPSNSSSFARWTEAIKLRVSTCHGEPISLFTNSGIELKAHPRVAYSFDGRGGSRPHNTQEIFRQIDDYLLFLSVDVVKEYKNILFETLNVKPTPLYRFLTGLPIPYTYAPTKTREFLMGKTEKQNVANLCDVLSLDALRHILATAIEKLSKKKLVTNTWKGKKCAVLLTHDIDTGRGLRRAGQLKRIESKYGVRSAWFVPSKRYRLDLEIVKELADWGEVGAHDTKHDGRLGAISMDRLVPRLREARQMLEIIVREKITGFRAPLLEHNSSILQALGLAGYSYDTSIPTWEPRHPTTMKPHGISTVFPLFIGSVLEIPVSLPQDHQLMKISKLRPHEAIHQWVSMINTIKQMNGLCTILVHPDYELADQTNLGTYEELLNVLTSDNELLLSLPREIVTLTDETKAEFRV